MKKLLYVFVFLLFLTLCACGSTANLNLRNINWDIEIKDVDKTFDENVYNSTPNLNSSNGFYYSRLIELDSVKYVDYSPRSAIYSFDDDKKLKEISVVFEPYDQKIIDSIIELADETVISNDSDNYKEYFLKMENNKVNLICNYKADGIVLTITPLGDNDFFDDLAKDSFSINEIDWSLSRDDIKALYKNKSIKYNGVNEKSSPLGYEFANITDISSAPSPVIFYFNADNSIKHTYIIIQNTESTLANLLKYFNLTPEKGKTEWETTTENAYVVVRIDSKDEISIFLYNKISKE